MCINDADMLQQHRKKTVSSTDGTIKFLAVIFAKKFPKLTPN